MPWWDDYEPSRPRPVRGGIKARSQRGDISSSWWGKQWAGALKRIMDPGRLSRGRSYARRGQVMNIEEAGGGVTAQVQGSRSRPYKVKIEIEWLPDEVWEQVFDLLARQAIFSVQLLTGEMPAEIEQVFSAAGASLFPTSRRQIVTSCSCPDPVNPCKHIAAVYFLLGEAFDADPFMLFRLRGRTQEQVLEALRARRTEQDKEDKDESPLGFSDKLLVNGVPYSPLPEDPLEFWSAGASLEDFQIRPRRPEIQFSLLQRLGQPSFINQNLTNLLAPVYLAITEKMEALAFQVGDTSEPTGK